MFKKYVFESRDTRYRRLMKLAIFACFSLFFIFLLLSIYIPTFAKNQKEKTELAFYQKAPDVIVAFTGDRGRIDHALDLVNKYPNAKVFISGVYSKNSLKSIINKRDMNMSIDEFLELEGHQIEIDYLARNTVENGITTMRFLRSIPNVKSVMILSSDYHILRVSLIMNTLSHGYNYNFYYDSIESDYSTSRDLKILLKEIYKLFKTSTFLIFWDKEISRD